MEWNNINQYLLNYMNNDKTDCAVMLNGKWGSGKSFYIQNKLLRYLENNKKKAIVISLYGIDDFDLLNKNIYMEARFGKTFNHSEREAVLKVIGKNIIKGLFRNANIQWDISKEDLKNIYKSINLKDYLIILEDIERSKIDICELLGYVYQLVNADKVKVLLVNNEDEFINTVSKYLQDNSGDEKKTKIVTEYSDDTKRYLRKKEKVIGDTVLFEQPLEEALGNIIGCKGYDKTLKRIVNNNKRVYCDIIRQRCSNNLRTLIKALQKADEIFVKLQDVIEDDAVLNNIVGSLLIYYSKNKDPFVRWEGTKYLSTSLGSMEIPMLRFVYDQIKNHMFDLEDVPKIIDAYKKYMFFESEQTNVYSCDYFSILDHFDIHSDDEVVNAFKEVLKDIKIPGRINIYCYSRIANYIAYVADIVEFDCEEIYHSMIENAKTVDDKDGLISDYFRLHKSLIDGKPVEGWNKYVSIIDSIMNALKTFDYQFDYKPSKIHDFCERIELNINSILLGRRFLCKYDLNRLVLMLQECSPLQLGEFRDMLSRIYKNDENSDFDNKEKECLEVFREDLKKVLKESSKLGKIQKYQMDLLCKNVNRYCSALAT